MTQRIYVGNLPYSATEGGMLAVQDPEAAAAEIRRCKNQRTRFAACLLPSQTYLGKTYGDEFFWPIFEEAERQDMPLAIHGAPSRGLGFDHFPEFARVHALEASGAAVDPKLLCEEEKQSCKGEEEDGGES